MKLLPRAPASAIAVGVLLLAALVLFVLLPPASVRLDSSAWSDLAARTVAGAYHVHSTRSDGSADKATIASAAHRAGLRFLILTDHGDGTRPPDPPAYLDGVLCVDGVEISTDDGHYVALDMPRAPYPLGGSAASVVEDVQRLGGFGVAAHPDSPKEALRWSDEDAPIDGIEWLNGDSEWRDESRASLWRAAAGYLFRPGPSLALLLDRPSTLDRWDRLTKTRPVVALAGLDAHGGFGRREEDGSRSSIPGIPGYDAMFRTFSIRAVLEQPWSGDAASDARALFAAIRAGRVLTTIDAIASNGLLDFHAEAATTTYPIGSELPAGTAATLVGRALEPSGAQIVLLHDGREVASSGAEVRQSIAGGQGAYRIEVHVPGGPGDPPIPWMVSNPIYFLNPRERDIEPPVSVDGVPIEAGAWRIEKDPGSSAILRTRNGEVELEYSLRDGARASQYVAVATDVNRVPFGTVLLSLAADRPMRASVQVRSPDGRRWGRSLYVPVEGRQAAVALGSLRPLDPGNSSSLDPSAIQSLLLVIDLTNANPGRRGTLRVRSCALGK